MTAAADAVVDGVSLHQSVRGVRLDDGEVVILAVREHWSVPAIWGGAPTVLLLGFLGMFSLGSASPMPANLLGILTALAITPLIAAVMRHGVRRYVLTDRRVIVRHGRDCRWVALPAVTSVETDTAAGRVGDVRFVSARCVLVWSRVADATGTAQIAREAISRYGNN